MMPAPAMPRCAASPSRGCGRTCASAPRWRCTRPTCSSSRRTCCRWCIRAAASSRCTTSVICCIPEAHRPADRRYLDWSTRWNARQASLVIADSAGHQGRSGPRLWRGREQGARGLPGPRRDPWRAWAMPGGWPKSATATALGERYLLYVGTFQPRKNLARIVAAFARIAGDPALAGMQLVLAGKLGWLYADLFAQVGRLGLEQRVRFPGYIADADLPALLSAALAFVFPSLYEGFGIPVLEAGACGVPVITSNTSSLPEVAGDPAAGPKARRPAR